MQWVTVTLPVGELADEAAALLACIDEVAHAGLEVRDREVVLYAPREQAEDIARRLREAAVKLREAGHDADAAKVRIEAFAPESEWRDAWKRYFRVDRVTRQLVIVPGWETFEPGSDDLVLHLDPGGAFGTGTHASTRLCLEALQDIRDRRHDVTHFLDMGTGSGILSIAAALLWPDSRGLAVDIDPVAVTAAADNLEANGLSDRVTAAGEDSPDAPSCQVVLANIQADVLGAMAGTLAGRVAPGGELVLAGILAPQADEVADAFAGHRLTLGRTRVDDRDPQWVCLRLSR